VERIPASWLQLEHAEIAAAQSKTSSVAVAGFVSRRLDRAHHRFLTSLGALAILRRLLPDAGDSGGCPDGPAISVPPVMRPSISEDGAGRPRLRIAGHAYSRPESDRPGTPESCHLDPPAARSASRFASDRGMALGP
jgi:hypothetical protein